MSTLLSQRVDELAAMSGCEAAKVGLIPLLEHVRQIDSQDPTTAAAP